MESPRICLKVVNRQQSGPLPVRKSPSKIEVRLRRKHPAPNRVRKTFDFRTTWEFFFIWIPSPQTQKVVIYTRISTDKQTPASRALGASGLLCSPRMEERRRDYGCSFQHKVIPQQVEDHASCSAVRRGKVDAVMCFKLDRLGRESRTGWPQIIGEFAAHNVALVVPSQGIDTSASNPAARLQLNVLCAVAEFERGDPRASQRWSRCCEGERCSPGTAVDTRWATIRDCQAEKRRNVLSRHLQAAWGTAFFGF